MPAKQMCSQAKLFFGQRPATALGSVLLLAFVAAGAVTAWAEWWAPLRALDRARKAVHLEQWQRAQVHLDQVLSRNPDCMEARLFAARVATARQDYLKALEWVREIPDGDAHGAEARLREGEILSQLNRGAEAEAALQRRLSLVPDCVQARRLLADLYRFEDREQAAIDLLWQLYDAAPDELKIEPLKELFLARFASFVDGAALHRLHEMVEQNPKDADAEAAIGSRLYKGFHKGGDPQAAEQFLTECLNWHPEHVGCRAYLVRCVLDLGEGENAGRLLADWPAAGRDIRYSCLLGEYQQEFEKKYAGAAENFRQVLAADPADHKTRHRLGQCLQVLGDIEQAQRELDRAAKLRERNNYNTVQRLIGKNIPEVNGNASLCEEIAQFYEDLGLTREAACWYRETLRRRPNDSATRAGLESTSAASASRSGSSGTQP